MSVIITRNCENNLFVDKLDFSFCFVLTPKFVVVISGSQKNEFSDYYRLEFFDVIAPRLPFLLLAS